MDGLYRQLRERHYVTTNGNWKLDEIMYFWKFREFHVLYIFKCIDTIFTTFHARVETVEFDNRRVDLEEGGWRSVAGKEVRRRGYCRWSSRGGGLERLEDVGFDLKRRKDGEQESIEEVKRKERNLQQQGRRERE